MKLTVAVETFVKLAVAVTAVAVETFVKLAVAVTAVAVTFVKLTVE